MISQRCITIDSECDRVRVQLPVRLKALPLLIDEAERVAEELDKFAAYCERWVQAGGARLVLTGGSRGAKVRSWDGRVWVHFDSITDVESMPYEAARYLAAELRAKVPEARERITITWRPSHG